MRKNDSKKKILEIGSGQGFHAYLLSKNKNNNVLGIDLSKEDVEISKKRYPNIKFRAMSAEKLIFKDRYFDEIYAMDVLEHVNNLQKTLDEISRVLKIGGKVIINIPHYKSEKWLLSIRPSYFKEIHHVRVFKEDELDKLMKEKKFITLKKKKEGFLQHVELFFLFNRRISSKTQLSIGSWRDNIFTKALHAAMLYFDPIVIHTSLVYFPIWIITIPAGYIANLLGNIYFPKSFYYEFKKIKI